MRKEDIKVATDRVMVWFFEGLALPYLAFELYIHKYIYTYIHTYVL